MGKAKNQPVWSKRVMDLVNEANVQYCAGWDVKFRAPADLRLVFEDLWTNRAQTVMLARQGILTRPQAAAILRALAEIERLAREGRFEIPPDAEDVHMAIEREVTRLAGPDSGGWLHTGRSRNDQAATDIRLWMRRRSIEMQRRLAALGGALCHHAERHLETVCPGFTHMQPAMITTWAHIVEAWAEGIYRDLYHFSWLMYPLTLHTECPLGAAASFGVSWPIDRAMTSDLLGFTGIQENTLDCISSRGEAERFFVFCLAEMINRLSCIGQDLILFSTPPRDWLRLDDRFVTGSSIMPQKRNPDFAEVTRAKAAHVTGLLTSLYGIGRAAPSGYNRDMQWTKYLLFDAWDECEAAPLVFMGVFESLEVNAAAMRAACDTGFMNATDVAEALAASSRLPFRASYRILGEAVARCEASGRLDRETLNRVLAASWPALSKEGLAPAGGAPLQFSADLWAEIEEPLSLLRRRRHVGSPAPENVKAQLQKLRRDFEGHFQNFILMFEKFDAKARQRLEKEISDLLEEKSKSKPAAPPKRRRNQRRSK